jgi:hypothetical protein
MIKNKNIQVLNFEINPYILFLKVTSKINKQRSSINDLN